MSKKDLQIQKLMESLGITKEEALEIIAFDNEEIELEEVNEITEKAKGLAKTDVKRGRKPGTKTGMLGVQNQTRKKKENPTKATIIDTLFKAIQELEGVTNATNPNKEKTILFELDGNTFEIDLKQKRKPKA